MATRVGVEPRVRSAALTDLETAASLVESAGLPTDGLAAQFGEQYAVAVAEGGAPIGVAGVEIYGGYGLLRSVAVRADWRGRGVGAALTKDRIAYARARGLSAVYALTTTAADYFPRLGFEVIARAAVPAEVASSPEFTTVCPSTATALRLPLADELTAVIRAKYGEAARAAAAGKQAGCGSGCGCGGDVAPQANPITSDLYAIGETSVLPETAVLASLGCGNPTALAELRPGEVVLDLGSGGGIDVLLSARRVGPTGKAYGLDMTDEMLALARENQQKAGVTNVEFLKGSIESIPLPDASVDVIISNCVINLSADKRRVLAESFRVLKPGGRFAVSDIVARGELPEAARRDLELWVGCVAGALAEDEFVRLLREVGFEDASIEPTRVYGAEVGGPELAGKIMSAFVRAVKPPVPTQL